jgi:hypothetical protein
MADSTYTVIETGLAKKKGYMVTNVKPVHPWYIGLGYDVNSLAEDSSSFTTKLYYGTDGFDTGFVYIDANATLTIEHNLGNPPKRATIFFCTVQEPVEGLNDIEMLTSGYFYSSDIGAGAMYGVKLAHTGKNDSKVTTTGYITDGGAESGYIRVFLWR